MNAVRSDHIGGAHDLAIFEADLGMAVGLNNVDAAACEMDGVGVQPAHAVDQHRVQVAAMKEHVGKAVALLRGRTEVVPIPRPAGAPMADFLAQRQGLNGAERLFESERVQDARAVRADLDAGAEFAEPHGLLIDLHIEAAAEQRERGRQTPDAAADHGDPVWYGHFRIPAWTTRPKVLPRSID